MSILSQIKPPKGSIKRRKRVGRGPGSGHGKTCCKGHKGQKSRSGAKISPAFEGGQMPMNRRWPKRGFYNLFAKEIAILNLDDLAKIAGADTNEIDVEVLIAEGRIKKAKDGVKILGRGELSRALTIKAHQFSASAREKISASGGTIVEIS